MAITIKDVAREANVSVATVSRALNGLSTVTDKTRARVMKIAAEMNFVPSSAARSLISRRTQTIGALLPDLHGEFFSELIRGIDQAARAHGLHLLLSSIRGDAAEAAAAMKSLHGRVDGLLVMSPHADAAFLDKNLPKDIPAVLMNSRIGGGFPSFSVDNYGGSVAMMRHLVARGHQHIALIAGPEHNFEAQERLRGYRDIMAQLVPDTEELVLQGDFSEESGWRAGSQVLALAQRPTAVFAANDMMAIGCLFALNEAGVKVPNEIALAGFDDIPMARFVSPPLTTVRVRIAELGSMALERLAMGIEHPERMSASPQTLRSELVVRSSCGRAPEGLVLVGSTKSSSS
ncbi:LacI family DNA-binding transcriptional regulator [Rhodoferax sp.]|uniref:LacI family DNA-binding transcriptional regulator n=1 Tax=Rhodoferax sp. TaxID=50421 RepID=UPI002763A2DE|nr:LacI family DNA-binding transcriptional regulator [Rhodoferax sp.]